MIKLIFLVQGLNLIEGILPGTNQYYLGCGPTELGKGRGILPWYGDQVRHR